MAMNSLGDWVAVWESVDQDGSGTGIFAQRYDAKGNPVGSEFRVNNTGANNQTSPDVALDDTGRFVVVWASAEQDGSGYGIYAQRYNSDGLPAGGEFLVNTFTAGAQSNPAVAMNRAGRFVVVWQSNGQDGSSFGVYAQRYNADGTLAGDEFQVNTTTDGFQGDADVALDDAGNFVIVWSSPDGSDTGVYARRYQADGTPAGGEFPINVVTSGRQGFSTVSLDGTGNFVVAWSSDGQDGDGQGIYARRYNSSATALAGEFPVNSATADNQSNPALTMNGDGRFVIVWQSFLQDGSGFGIYAQGYNADGSQAGGEFPVSIFVIGNQQSPAAAMDGAGNFVIAWASDGQDGSGYGVYAQRYNADGTPNPSDRQVNTYTSFLQIVPAVAMDPAGNFVIAWASQVQDGSEYGIYAQRYDAAGIPVGNEFLVNTTTNGNQRAPAVAMDGSGNFIIVWSGAGQTDDSGIYARRFGADGVPFGNEFRVNTYTDSIQDHPVVAMDGAGNFVIAWHSSGQDTSGYGIIAQRYDSSGTSSGEFFVNSHILNNQSFPSIGMDGLGNFVIAWQSYGQDHVSPNNGVFAQRYGHDGIPIGGPFLVNTFRPGDQQSPAVAMNSAGSFVIAWTSEGQEISGFDVYAQRYGTDGIPSGGEFRVNTYTTDDQKFPSVAMDNAGNFMIAWASNGQEGGNVSDIYAQRFNQNGTPAGSEFRINTYTDGSQYYPALSTANGRWVAAWESLGQDGSFSGVFMKLFSFDRHDRYYLHLPLIQR